MNMLDLIRLVIFGVAMYFSIPQLLPHLKEILQSLPGFEGQLGPLRFAVTPAQPAPPITKHVRNYHINAERYHDQRWIMGEDYDGPMRGRVVGGRVVNQDGEPLTIEMEQGSRATGRDPEDVEETVY